MNDVKRLYFQWMYEISGVRDERILLHLFRIPFTYVLREDANREADGIDLRYRFGIENHIPQPIIASQIDNWPCSVLEMMIALTFRIGETVSGFTNESQEIKKIFHAMLDSLGIGKRYRESEIDRAIDRFIHRRYSFNGKGGLFTLVDCPHDMKNIDIWRQAMQWVNENY